MKIVIHRGKAKDVRPLNPQELKSTTEKDIAALKRLVAGLPPALMSAADFNNYPLAEIDRLNKRIWGAQNKFKV